MIAFDLRRVSQECHFEADGCAQCNIAYVDKRHDGLDGLTVDEALRKYQYMCNGTEYEYTSSDLCYEINTKRITLEGAAACCYLPLSAAACCCLPLPAAARCWPIKQLAAKVHIERKVNACYVAVATAPTATSMVSHT